MTINIRINREKLPGDVALQAWATTGSAVKAAGYLFQQGYVGPNGKALSYQTVYKRALEYAINNPDEARPYFSSDIDDERWDAYLMQSAKSVYSEHSNQFDEWLAKFPHLAKYL